MNWENPERLQKFAPNPREVQDKKIAEIFSLINRTVKNAADKTGVTYVKEGEDRNHAALDYLGFIQEDGDMQNVFPSVKETVDRINQELADEKSPLQVGIEYVPTGRKVDKPGIVVYIR